MVKNIFKKNQKKLTLAKKPNSKKTISLSLKLKKASKGRLIVGLIVLFCIVLLGVTGWLGWTKIVMNPDRVLDDAISNSLRVNSVTKEVVQSQPNGSVTQTSYISFFPPSPSVQSKTVLSQKNGSKTATVTTETIGTTDADYVRYSSVEAAEGLSGVDNLKGLLGKWAKRQKDPASGVQLSFLNESVFSVVPFGNLNGEQQKSLKQLIDEKNVYKYSSAEKRIENGRLVYVYNASISPEALVSVVQEYVKATGFGDPSQYDPAQYKGLSNVQINLTVDIFSRQVLRAEYPNGRVENYSGHNLYRPLQLPQETISIEELQRRLQGLPQQG